MVEQAGDRASYSVSAHRALMVLRGAALWLLMVVGSALLLWMVLDLTYVATDNETDYAAPADVIIVLGCPSYEGNVLSTTFSACVQARAHHAARLYKRGLASNIIATGGLTGPPPSEAAAMAQVMTGDGVPEDAITLEEQARNTVGNIRFSREIMRAQGWKTAILVTEPNHIKRATLIARDGGLSVFPSPVIDSPGWRNPQARLDNVLRDARNVMIYRWGRLWGAVP